MAVAHVDPQPDVPVERLKRGRSNKTFSADPKDKRGGGYHGAVRRWRAWFGGETFEYPEGVERPRSRADCLDMPRPCPFVSCSHHLYLDANPLTGALTINHPHLEVDELAETCSLDVADRGGITLEEVGSLVSLTRERCRQIEERGLSKIKDHTGNELGLPPERRSNAGEGWSWRRPGAL